MSTTIDTQFDTFEDQLNQLIVTDSFFDSLGHKQGFSGYWTLNGTVVITKDMLDELYASNVKDFIWFFLENEFEDAVKDDDWIYLPVNVVFELNGTLANHFSHIAIYKDSIVIDHSNGPNHNVNITVCGCYKEDIGQYI